LSSVVRHGKTVSQAEIRSPAIAFVGISFMGGETHASRPVVQSAGNGNSYASIAKGSSRWVAIAAFALRFTQALITQMPDRSVQPHHR